MKLSELMDQLQKLRDQGYTKVEVGIDDGRTRDIIEARGEDLAGLVIIETE